MDDGMTHHCVASVSEVQEFDIIQLGFVFFCFFGNLIQKQIRLPAANYFNFSPVEMKCLRQEARGHEAPLASNDKRTRPSRWHPKRLSDKYTQASHNLQFLLKRWTSLGVRGQLLRSSACTDRKRSILRGHAGTTQVDFEGVAGNRDWAAVTASLCILAHVAQSCCTQAARMLESRSSTCMWSARCESGTLCRFFFERLRCFQVVLCRPFSFLWRIISQKCPHQLFWPSLDRLRRHRCLRSSIAQRRSPELRANGEIHKHVRTLRRAQTRQLSERSLERCFAAERNPVRVVALSTVKRSVEVHRFIIAHCCTAALAECTWCKFDSSSLASWAREGTHGNHKMAICRAAASQSFRSTVREGRRKLVFVRWRRLPWAHPGAPAGAPWIRNL